MNSFPIAPAARVAVDRQRPITVSRELEMLGSGVLFLAVHCAFGTVRVTVNDVPIWRQSVLAAPIHATVTLNPWLTARRDTVSIVLSDIPDRKARAGDCRFTLVSRTDSGEFIQGRALWSEADAPPGAPPPHSWQFTVDLPDGIPSAPPLPERTLTNGEIERVATHATLELHSALAAGRFDAALDALGAGIARRAASSNVPEAFYRAAWLRLFKALSAGKDFQVAALAAEDLEFLHGRGDVLLIQRRGYARSSVILASSSAGSLAGELHWIGGKQGGLALEVNFIPEAVQWER